jgi:hypothetical protein
VAVSAAAELASGSIEAIRLWIRFGDPKPASQHSYRCPRPQLVNDELKVYRKSPITAGLRLTFNTPKYTAENDHQDRLVGVAGSL